MTANRMHQDPGGALFCSVPVRTEFHITPTENLPMNDDDDPIARLAARVSLLAHVDRALASDPQLERDLRDRLGVPSDRDKLVAALHTNCEMARQELARLLDQGDVFAVDACLKATWGRAVADRKFGWWLWKNGVKGIWRWAWGSWLTGWRRGWQSKGQR